MDFGRLLLCLLASIVAGASGDNSLSKVVATAKATLGDASASKIVADVEKVATSPNTGEAMATAEKAAVQTVVTHGVAPSGQETRVQTPVVESTPSKEKTTQAVLEAVSIAEERTSTPEDQKAAAVVDATVNVLKMESTVDKVVAPQVIAKAKEDAKETFEQLDGAKVGTKAAADAAAKVALAEIDGASGDKLAKAVQTNAEKAAVAAGKGVADHPHNLAGAVSEAIATVKKEENSTGAVDVNKTDKGLVAGAVASTEKVVADVTAGVTAEANAVVEHQSGSVAFPLFLALGLAGYWWMNNVYAEKKVSPYMGALMTFRKEGEKGSTDQPFERKDCEFAEYREFP